jgi:hypothetical protein
VTGAVIRYSFAFRGLGSLLRKLTYPLYGPALRVRRSAKRLGTGDIEEAYSSAPRALALDRDCQDMIALVEQVERRL